MAFRFEAWLARGRYLRSYIMILSLRITFFVIAVTFCAPSAWAGRCEDLFSGNATPSYQIVKLARYDDAFGADFSEARRSGPFLSRWLLEPRRLSDLSSRYSFADVATVSVEIAKLFPKDRYFVVGIGRSPFPIVDFLNLLAPESAMTLPISYSYQTNLNQEVVVRKYQPDYMFMRGHRGALALTAMLDRLMPSREKVGNRQIVVLDFSNSGRSVSTFSIDLHTYLRDAGRPADHAVVGIGDPMNKHQLEKNLREYYHALQIYDQIRGEGAAPVALPRAVYLSLDEKLFDFSEMLNGELYKGFAPYRRYDPTMTKKGVLRLPTVSQAHDRFVRALTHEFNSYYKTNSTFHDTIDRLRK